MKTHYDTLGVRRDASHHDIKAEFRKLSLELHPDVGGTKACAERFKEVSIAAGVLTNERKRRAYDYQLKEANALGSLQHHKHSPFGGFTPPTGTTSRRPGPGVASTPMQIFVSNIMRPRSFALGFVAVVLGTSVISYLGGGDQQSNKHQHGQDLIKAWKNPKSGVYEQPAPWDPDFKRLNPKLEDVPRELVLKRQR